MQVTIQNAKEKLLDIRQKNGLTFEKLAEKTGVSKQTLISIESGRVKPQATTIFKINQFLEKSNAMV